MINVSVYMEWTESNSAIIAWLGLFSRFSVGGCWLCLWGPENKVVVASEPDTVLHRLGFREVEDLPGAVQRQRHAYDTGAPGRPGPKSSSGS